jgi:phospholipase/carboxylesterase
MLDYLQRDLGENPAFTVIWLHGLGADGHDFEPIVPELNLPPASSVRFIFPHAPEQAVTINGGMVMRSWYDILSMEIARQVDEAGIDQSAELVKELLAQELDRGISSDHILLAGFSQGGAIALHTALQYDKPLLGILALSTYLPVPGRIPAGGNTANQSTPIFMGHGTQDPVVPMQLGRQSCDHLVEQGYSVAWHSYPMQHSVNMDEIRDVGVWMTTLLQIRAE